MILATFARNALLQEFGALMAGGALELYDGKVTEDVHPFQQLLVSVPLADPAFRLAGDGSIVGANLPAAEITNSGEASWARVVDKAGTVIATLTVAKSGTDSADTADVVVNRTDLQWGGLCTVERLTFKWPTSA